MSGPLLSHLCDNLLTVTHPLVITRQWGYIIRVVNQPTNPMTINLTTEQTEELVSVLDIFVMDGIDEDNTFNEVYQSLVNQLNN